MVVFHTSEATAPCVFDRWLLYAVCAMPGSLDECVCVGFCVPARGDCTFSARGVRVGIGEPDLILNSCWYLLLLSEITTEHLGRGGRWTLCPVLSLCLLSFSSPQTCPFGEEQPPHTASSSPWPASQAGGVALGLLRCLRWDRKGDFISLMCKRLTKPWSGAGCLLPKPVFREGSGLQRIKHY